MKWKWWEEPQRVDPMGQTINNFHVFLFVVAAVNGLFLTAGVETSGAIQETLNSWQVRVYGFMLALGGLSVVAGIYWPKDPRDGLLLKRFGYTALGIVTAVYGGAVIVVSGSVKGGLAGSIAMVFGFLCLDQMLRINARIKLVQHIEEDLAGDDDA